MHEHPNLSLVGYLIRSYGQVTGQVEQVKTLEEQTVLPVSEAEEAILAPLGELSSHFLFEEHAIFLAKLRSKNTLKPSRYLGPFS